MKRKITIKNANLTKNQLFLQVNESISGLIPGEQILVDSSQFSFIYLMEDQEDYTYIVIPEAIWPLLKGIFDNETSVWIKYNDEQIELTNFNEEFKYVISNIQGNSNYGNEMVMKVEHIFLDTI